MVYIMSLRRLCFCLVVAMALNCLNFIYMRFYETNGKRVFKYYYPKTESGVENDRSLVEDMFKSISSICNDEAAPTVNLSEIFYKIKATNKTAHKNKVIGELDYCPELPPGLDVGTGEDSIPYKVANTRQFDIKYSDVKVGGIYKPLTCRPRQSAAVIIAYRGSKKSLTTFLLYLHPFLVKQQLDYQIFVLRQSNSSQHFNRGMLLNIGFIEAQKRRKNGWNCILFHEAHIVPTDSRNLYRCSWYPRQLAVFVERPLLFPYVPKFGGAVALTPEQFLKVNGFSNKYWGNDAEFEDLYNRLLRAHYFIENSLPNLGTYKTLDSYGGAVRIKSEYLLSINNGRSPIEIQDGLTSLTYKVEYFDVKRMYTYLKVHIDDANDTESYRLFRGSIPIQLA